MGSIGAIFGVLPELITTGSSTLWDIFVAAPFTIITGITP